MAGVDYKMDFFVKDFLASTALWSGAERGCYSQSLIVAWTAGAVLPLDPERIRGALNYTPEEWVKLWPVIESKWPIVGDHRENPRQRAVWKDASRRGKIAAANRATGREGGLASARKRASAASSESASDRSSESTSDEATPFPVPRSSPSLDENGESISEGTPRSLRSRGARFKPPKLDEIRAFWENTNLAGDPDDFFDHFENAAWKLSGGKGAVMKDWRLAAQRWSRTEKKRDNGRARRPPTVGSHGARPLDGEPGSPERAAALGGSAHVPTDADLKKWEADTEREYAEAQRVHKAKGRGK